MDLQSHVFRFQEGVRSRHLPPEASFEPAPPGTPAAAGSHLAVMVDLNPPLPHRSREIRVLATEAYWTVKGSVVARLRRALAEANRYLARANAHSSPRQRTSGNITCVALFEDELFVGQVGDGQAMLYQPEGGLETFPQDDESLLPLGATVPPVIHIGYANVGPNSTLLLTSTKIAEDIDKPQWVADLAQDTFTQTVENLTDRMAGKGKTGGLVLFRYPMTEAKTSIAPKRTFLLPRGRRTTQHTREQSAPPEPVPAAKPERTSLREAPPVTRPEPVAPVEPAPQRSALSELADRVRSLKFPRIRLSKLRLPQARTQKKKPSRRSGTRRAWTLPRINLKPVLKTLLPGKIEGPALGRHRRRVPEENSTVMAGLAVGLLLIMLFITVTMYFQPREDTLLQQADETWQTALETQDIGDWKRLSRITDQILALDPQNTEAQRLHETAKKAIAVTENATILNATPIMELGTSPSPRRLVVAQSWIYVLNPATDEVRGLPLKEGGIVPATDAPTPILKAGQVLPGTSEPVGSLVDIAWMRPGPGYPDGAVFIYSEDGYLYIYEPHIGPSNIDRQKLEGEIQPIAITLIETYSDQFYALDRYANQVWKYVPVNGVYDGEPRAYFGPAAAPQLQTALAMDLDGRLHLLLGDGVIHTYFRGTEDVSFRLDGLPIDDFQPTVMALETSSDTGLIYLGDARQSSLIALNKRGQYQYQFRLADDTLKKLEALAVNEEPKVLYFVASNRLHAAPLPASVSP